jgi:hypothetical protein
MTAIKYYGTPIVTDTWHELQKMMAAKYSFPGGSRLYLSGDTFNGHRSVSMRYASYIHDPQHYKEENNRVLWRNGDIIVMEDKKTAIPPELFIIIVAMARRIEQDNRFLNTNNYQDLLLLDTLQPTKEELDVTLVMQNIIETTFEKHKTATLVNPVSMAALLQHRLNYEKWKAVQKEQGDWL